MKVFLQTSNGQFIADKCPFAHNKTKEEANMTTNEYAMSILQVRKEDKKL